jgi:hypothetical protein
LTARLEALAVLWVGVAAAVALVAGVLVAGVAKCEAPKRGWVLCGMGNNYLTWCLQQEVILPA